MSATADFIAGHVVELLAAVLVTISLLAGLLWRWLASVDDAWWQRAVVAWNRVSQRTPLKQLRQRHPQLLAFLGRRLQPGGYLGLHLSIGFVVAFIALACFMVLAEAVHAGEIVAPFDTALASAMQRTLSHDLLRAAYTVTQLGNFKTLLWIGVAVAAILAVYRQYLMLSAWIVATAGNGLLNRGMKELFQRVRPLHDHGWVVEHGWSFPSGHASGSLAIYGMLAYLLMRLLPQRAKMPLLMLATALILAIGFSRVLLQVHYLSDVIAGFASALVWLSVCITGAEVALRHRQSSRSPRQ